MNNKNQQARNYGFIEPIQDLRDYIFGAKRSAPSDILQLDGQWDKYLPSEDEIQNKNIESLNCTGYGTLNILEILGKRKFNENWNFSERYTGIMAGTDPAIGGNDPNKVIENIRTIAGLIDEKLLPVDDTIRTEAAYYYPKPMIEDFIKIGKSFLANYVINHEWVQNGDLIQALKHSPLGIGVYAWEQDENGLYIRPQEAKDTHWTVLYGYEKNKYWKILDSYDNTKKKLRWDFGFKWVKRYYVKKLTISQRRTLLSGIIAYLKNYLNIK